MANSPLYYIKSPDGSYYRNDRFEQMPLEPVWVKDKAEASLVSKERATALTEFWQSEKLELEPYQPPAPNKQRRQRE